MFWPVGCFECPALCLVQSFRKFVVNKYENEYDKYIHISYIWEISYTVILIWRTDNQNKHTHATDSIENVKSYNICDSLKFTGKMPQIVCVCGVIEK